MDFARYLDKCIGGEQSILERQAEVRARREAVEVLERGTSRTGGPSEDPTGSFQALEDLEIVLANVQRDGDAL